TAPRRSLLAGDRAASARPLVGACLQATGPRWARTNIGARRDRLQAGSYRGGRGTNDGGRGTNDGGFGANDGGFGTNDGGRGTNDGGFGTNDDGRIQRIQHRGQACSHSRTSPR